VPKFVSISPLRAVLIPLCLLVITGCRHGIIVKAPVGAPIVAATTGTDAKPAKFDASTIDPGQYTVTDYLNQKQAYENAVTTGGSSLDTAKAVRNDIVYGMMTQIEIVYSQKYASLFGGKNTVAIAGDGLVLGLSAASSISTNLATKTILSALGTAFSGLNLSIDKNFYSQESFQIIGIAMQTRRDKIRAVIIANLAKDVATYPLNAARRDLITYLQAGTLPSGLQELQEEAGAATAKQAQATTASAAPGTPTGVVLNPGVTDAVVSWSSVPTATFYKVYYSQTKGVAKTSSNLTGITAPFAAIGGLTAGGTYYFAVSAINSAGESDLSTEVSTTLQPASSTALAGGISAPQNVKAIKNGSSVTVFWDASAGADHYIVDRVIKNGAAAASDNAINETVEENIYTDSTASLATSPSYSVYAVDASGKRSSESTIVAPVDVTASNGSAGVVPTPH
jgi:hypothetical protein